MQLFSYGTKEHKKNIVIEDDERLDDNLEVPDIFDMGIDPMLNMEISQP